MSETFDFFHGFVKLVDMMGDDYRVLEAARVSTGSEARKGEDKDRKLIRYLMANEHHTPFEKITFEFHVKCPIFVARQWFRHRIGSYNEASARYKEFVWETFMPNEWRLQDDKNKQGSKSALVAAESAKASYMVAQAYDSAKRAYEEMLRLGVARELARIVMPVGIYTEFFWTVNFRALLNFLKLRTDSHAQYEIRQYANEILRVINETNKIPWTIEAATDFVIKPFQEK